MILDMVVPFKYYLVLLANVFAVIGFGQVVGYRPDFLIEGQVLSKEGEPIPNVSLTLKDYGNLITNTDGNGYFSMVTPAGEHILVCSHMSYEPFEVAVSIAQNDSKKQYYIIYLNEKQIALREVTVSGKILTAAASLKTIKTQHKRIAGGTSVVVMTPEVQRLETLKDAMKYEPGVVIQEFFGANDQPRLSIRGSGIQSNPQQRGVCLLQDGIPVNFADGSFIVGVMDPAIAESIEVFKGANALRYGAATLGGAVNFNSRNGNYSPGIQLKAEGGSFGYGQGNMMVGDSWKKSDGFLSVSVSRQDGFRQHNKNKKRSVSGNFGYRFSNNVASRIYVNYSYINFEIPGPLTMQLLLKDPTQINKGIELPNYMGPNIERDRPGREAEVLRIANRSALRLSHQTNLTVTLYYQLVKDRFAFPIVLSTKRSLGNDAGISMQMTHRIKKGTFTTGFLESHGNIDRRGHINVNGLDSYMFSKDKLNAVNLTFFTTYYHRFNERFHGVASIQAVSNERNSEDVFPDPEWRPWYSHTTHKYRYFHSGIQSMEQQFRAVNPRIGFICNTGKNKNIQFFGNGSSSYEPPTFDELVGTKIKGNINTSPKELFAIQLDKQSSVTAEIGSRCESKRYNWNISLYRSWLKNELLEVKDFVLGIKKTRNYPNTIHQGIEFGTTVIPFEKIFKAKDKIAVRAMYTYSDFYFSSGNYKGKQLAGVPTHYLTASVTYRNPGRFFLSLATESQPQKSPIDHTNTMYQPAFTIFGFRTGIEGWKNISFYIEGKNILNRYYVSSYIISDQIILPPIPFPNFTVDNVAFFMPGQTRAFYAGITCKF